MQHDTPDIHRYTEDGKSKYFRETMQLAMDTVQLARTNLQAFKESQRHKEVPKSEDMREDIAALQRAIDAFLARVKKKCNASTFRYILNDMSRDRLHDLSNHMAFMYGITNITDVTNLLRREHKIRELEINGHKRDKHPVTGDVLDWE